MKRQRFLFWMTFMILLLLCTVPAAAQSEEKVTPALDIIAGKCNMVKSCLCNNDLVFCAEDFEKVLNVSSISSITITSLPPRTDGVLCLGMSEVSVGQSISRANLERLYFMFENENIKTTSFYFTTNFGSYEIACELYALDEENKSPLAAVSSYTTCVSTYQDIKVYGKMEASDPEDDAVTFEIVSRPGHGILQMQDAKGGYYVYTPDTGFCGTDQFEYRAVDRYGHYSEKIAVTLQVDKRNDTCVTYEDMNASVYEVAAMKLTEANLVSGNMIDGRYYFYPNQAMDKMTFVVTAMKVLNIAVVSGQQTLFADNDSIPANIRPYVEKARRMGAVCGTLEEDGQLYFNPLEEITAAEAAVILQGLSGYVNDSAVSVFAENSVAPLWAKTAVATMQKIGIFDCFMGHWQGNETLTRATGTYMLYQIQQFQKWR